MWSPHHRHEMCPHHPESSIALDQQRRSRVLVKPRHLRPDIPPPPYDVLFGQDVSYDPPTYSSLALDQSMYLVSLCPMDTCESSVSASPVVTVVIEREGDTSATASAEVHREGSVTRNQSVPAIIDGPSRNKPFGIIFSIGNDYTGTFEDDHEVVN